MSDKGKICLHIKYPGDDLLFLAANYNKSVLSPTVTSRTDSELENKVKKTSERICENLHIIAVQALPPTVESRGEVSRLNTQLSGAFYDAECGLQ